MRLLGSPKRKFIERLEKEKSKSNMFVAEVKNQGIPNGHMNVLTDQWIDEWITPSSSVASYTTMPMTTMFATIVSVEFITQ